ncbi:MAG: cytochrome c [Gammaproteobacteria bacterium]|nr:cytochrome c [Gammaproteobacteria bacterium]MBT4606991.1 cytochrome c [Thiotrichales bacterium]MBT3473149.1 cytochrome c [Gammaproteobacteria bacterium]MBT3966361.1 cytochrome c [Gammaproteobacteria bacterium]MBT4080787.1 cytochrome c [Gammaproteobacteria bacterium]
MTMNRRISMVSIAAATLLLSGCGGENSYTPVAGSAPDVVFAEACQGCHGVEGAGKFGFLFKLNGTDKSVEELVAKIRSGGPIMPAFVGLDAATAEGIATYMKTLPAAK